MHTLDLDADNLRPVVSGDGDIEVSVKAQRFVVLTDLVVLGHVRVEVVLARHTTPLCDRAVQRKANADNGFDRGAIRHGHCSRQCQTHRADLCVGLGAKIRRTRAEHFGLRTELDVHFQTDHRLVARQSLVKGNSLHSAGASSMSR